MDDAGVRVAQNGLRSRSPDPNQRVEVAFAGITLDRSDPLVSLPLEVDPEVEKSTV
jgi:hypothetical protein